MVSINYFENITSKACNTPCQHLRTQENRHSKFVKKNCYY